MLKNPNLPDLGYDRPVFEMAAVRGFVRSLTPEQQDMFAALFSGEAVEKSLEMAREQCRHERAEAITQEESDAAVISAAIDYAFGRSTSVVHSVTDCIAAMMPELPEATQEAVAEKVNTMLETRSAGMGIDERAWRALVGKQLDHSENRPMSHAF